MRTFLQKLLATDSILGLMGKLTIVAVLGVFAVFVLGGAMLGLIQGTPGSAKELLEDTDSPLTYAVRAESIRQLEVGKTDIKQSRIAFAQLDFAHKKFTLDLAGYSSEDIRLFYDGKRTLKQDGKGSYDLTKNIAIRDITGPTPADILKAKPQFLDTDGTFLGEKAWVIEFKPTCLQLRTWIAAKTLESFSQNNSEVEYQALGKNDCKVKWAYAWIRDKDRHLVMVDMFFTVGKNVSYRYLYKYNLYGQVNLADLEIENK